MEGKEMSLGSNSGYSVVIMTKRVLIGLGAAIVIVSAVVTASATGYI